MNEVVVDRGPSPYLTNLEIFCNGRIMTSVQGDGMWDLHCNLSQEITGNLLPLIQCRMGSQVSNCCGQGLGNDPNGAKFTTS